MKHEQMKNEINPNGPPVIRKGFSRIGHDAPMMPSFNPNLMQGEFEKQMQKVEEFNPRGGKFHPW